MNIIDTLSKLLLTPPETGKRGLLISIVLIGVPTALRLSVDDYVTGVGFTPYTPFVLLAALLVGWRPAAAIAVASAVFGDILFVGAPRHLLEGPSDVFGVTAFLIASALIIGLVEAARSIVENALRPARPDGTPTQVVFSLQGGYAWASWYGSHSWVRLGPKDEVAEMMEDFLAQLELGRRLDGGSG